jgi:hypothetical protein
MDDRNKTELTQNITRNVALWLDVRGFKPVETEVGVARGWVADVAGVCCPTQTELIDLKIIKRPPRLAWEYHRPDDDPARLRYYAALAEWKAAYAAIPTMLTATVEVKTSVGDYRGDRKWTAETWPTNLAFVAMPEGMIDPSQWPAGWGVILFSKEGTTIRKTFPPSVRTVPDTQQLAVVHSIAVARDHVTRHARLRDLQKRARIDAGERTNISRIQHAVTAVKEILLRGKTAEEALSYVGFRTKLPEYIMNDLKSLEALRPAQTPKPAEGDSSEGVAA